ncbi:cystinosin [Nannizzia gypsea CBS 118893]|uniref:Cystinosin n=1 Tax=Arthroderma gypseum (strain ATCC MYA-4604 / CBS 118893) TaxID=535722 RepID=E4V6Y6_ARTGP|nr:cystinosin [Nannizzia gypsea CBS 118893]EFQ96852.1 cystinosin [Nannizzia gypsea CBS 118893]
MVNWLVKWLTDLLAAELESWPVVIKFILCYDYIYTMYNKPLAQTVSQGLGWTYFLLWTCSFYPQLIHNYRRRSTDGFSLNFTLLNLFGLAAYTIFNGSLLFSPVIRCQYAERHPQSPEPTVQINDFTYAIHGTIICLLIYSQLQWPSLWNFHTIHPSLKVHPFTIWILWCSTGAIALDIIGVSFYSTWTQREWLDIVNTIGNIKVFLTAIKYTPQAVMNWRYQSTEGFSILAVLLDLTGALLSLIQLVLDSSLQGDWSGIINNISKLLLGNITLLFDVVFLVQHYCLYRKRNLQAIKPGLRASEEDPLIPSNSAEGNIDDNTCRSPWRSHSSTLSRSIFSC